MEMTVTTTGCFYPDAERRQKLESLGFTFSFAQDVGEWCIEGEGRVQLDTIEQLVQFTEEFGSIVMYKNGIEIFDSLL
jgi:hypothetical protein